MIITLNRLINFSASFIDQQKTVIRIFFRKGKTILKKNEKNPSIKMLIVFSSKENIKSL